MECSKCWHSSKCLRGYSKEYIHRLKCLCFGLNVCYAEISRNELLRYHYWTHLLLYYVYTHTQTHACTYAHTEREGGKQVEKHVVQGERSQEDKEKDTLPLCCLQNYSYDFLHLNVSRCSWLRAEVQFFQMKSTNLEQTNRCDVANRKIVIWETKVSNLQQFFLRWNVKIVVVSRCS